MGLGREPSRGMYEPSPVMGRWDKEVPERYWAEVRFRVVSSGWFVGGYSAQYPYEPRSLNECCLHLSLYGSTAKRRLPPGLGPISGAIFLNEGLKLEDLSPLLVTVDLLRAEPTPSSTKAKPSTPSPGNSSANQGELRRRRTEDQDPPRRTRNPPHQRHHHLEHHLYRSRHPTPHRNRNQDRQASPRTSLSCHPRTHQPLRKIRLHQPNPTTPRPTTTPKTP